jgi:hypothetical protein
MKSSVPEAEARNFTVRGNFQSDMRIGKHGRLTNPRCSVRAMHQVHG